MSRSLSKSKVEDFEPRKKNPLGLLGDSNLDSHLKSLKIGKKTSPIQLSDSEVRFDADFSLNGKFKSHVIETDNQYLDFKTGSGGYIQFSAEGSSVQQLYPSGQDIYWLIDGDEFHYLSSSVALFEIYAHDDSANWRKLMSLNGTNNTLTLFDDADTGDKLAIKVDAAGVSSITTTDDDGTAAHFTLQPDGDLILDPVSTKVIINATDDLYFDGGGNTYITENSADNLRFYVGGDLICSMAENGSSGNQINISGASAGFSQIEPTFDATDTDVDFRKSNKQKLTLTDNCADVHFQFPAMSGNFICVLLQDGTGGRTISNWKTKDSAGNAGAGNGGRVLWAGGSAPSNTETADKADVASFYWDADNEIAYGTYSYNF